MKIRDWGRRIGAYSFGALMSALVCACATDSGLVDSGGLGRRPRAIADDWDRPTVEVVVDAMASSSSIPDELFARAGDWESEDPHERMARTIAQAMENSGALRSMVRAPGGEDPGADFVVVFAVEKMHVQSKEQLNFVDKRHYELGQLELFATVQLAYSLRDNIADVQLGEGREEEEVYKIPRNSRLEQDRFHIKELFNTEGAPHIAHASLRAIDRMVCDVAEEISRRTSQGSSLAPRD